MGRIVTAVALCVATGFLLGWFPLVSTDLGHHIATGRWILAHGAVPEVDVLSWTALGQPWQLYQWIADASLAAVDALGGWTGLVVLRALLVAALAGAIYFAAHARSRSHLAALVATVVCVALLQPRLLLRPMLAGYIALALLDGLLTRLERREHYGTRVAAHGVLVLWAAVHPLFLYGLVRWLLHGLIQIGRGRRAGAELLSFAVALLTGLAMVEALMPHGLETVLSVLDAGGDPYFAAMIIELQPFLSVYPVGALHLVVLVLWLVAVARAPGAWRPRLVGHAFVFALLVGALLKARLFAPFVIVAAPHVAVGVDLALIELARTRLARVGPALALGFAAVAVIATLLGSTMGFGVDRAENLYPRGAGVHLAMQPPARLYNDLMFGGFVLWDLDTPAFIDGRLEVYGSAFAHDPYRRIYSTGPNWHRHLDWLGVDAILLSPGRAGRLHEGLAGRGEWQPTYADDYAVVYRRVAN